MSTLLYAMAGGRAPPSRQLSELGWKWHLCTPREPRFLQCSSRCSFPHPPCWLKPRRRIARRPPAQSARSLRRSVARWRSRPTRLSGRAAQLGPMHRRSGIISKTALPKAAICRTEPLLGLGRWFASLCRVILAASHWLSVPPANGESGRACKRGTSTHCLSIPLRDFYPISAKVPTGLRCAELFYGARWHL